jgi:hypothetical protein
MSEEKRRVIGRAPIRPERIRSIAGQGFAFIPNNFLRQGFFVSLTPNELRLYILLVLAADRNGLSFYHYDSLCSLLEIPIDDYIEARDKLIKADLVAYDGTRFQVLSLPSKPTSRTVALENVESRAATEPSISQVKNSSEHEASPRSIEIYRQILSSLQRR